MLIEEQYFKRVASCSVFLLLVVDSSNIRRVTLDAFFARSSCHKNSLFSTPGIVDGILYLICASLA